jgi:hypothetical protein
LIVSKLETSSWSPGLPAEAHRLTHPALDPPRARRASGGFRGIAWDFAGDRWIDLNGVVFQGFLLGISGWIVTAYSGEKSHLKIHLNGMNYIVSMEEFCLFGSWITKPLGHQGQEFFWYQESGVRFTQLPVIKHGNIPIKNGGL